MPLVSPLMLPHPSLWALPVLHVLVLPTALVQMFAQQQFLNGKAKEDGIRNNKITVAGDDKVEDDNTCAVDYTARQKIATEDEGIVSELITIRNKLDSLGESLLNSNS